MNGDFSRDTSEPARLARFTRVLLQQGRPLLDADFNEQSAIHQDFLRTLIVDLMGRGWRPGKDAFVIRAADDPKDVFKITKGHFYVDGILCDNPHDCAYTAQPFPPDTKPIKDNVIFYVECWERHVSVVQRPELREIALGGADTSSRAQIVWQVRVATADWAKAQAGQVSKVLGTRMAAVAATDTEEAAALKDLSDSSSSGFLDTLTKDFSDAIGVTPLPTDFDAKSLLWFDALMAVPPRLRAQAKLDAMENEACSIAPDARYRGRENQLYRVEVHKGGTLADGPTFKWSRENGSVLFAVPDGAVIKISAPDSAGTVTLTVPLQTLGHDRRTGICVGDWVELTSDAFDIAAIALPLGQVKQVDRTRRSVDVQVDGADDDTVSRIAKCTVLRRWDQSENLDAKVKGTVAIAETGWIPLERGVQIQFQPGAVYHTGDYWLIPARVASQNVLWPQRNKEAVFVAPNGIARHRAVIGAAVTPSGGKWTPLDAGRTLTP